MTYLCYIHRRTGASPYFEVLPDMPRLNAIERAGAMLAERPDGERAELWQDEELVFTLPRFASRPGPAAPLAPHARISK